MKFSLSYQNHLYSGMYAQHPAQKATAFYPQAASIQDTAAIYTNDAFVTENHSGNVDYCYNAQSQMETESNEHGVSNKDRGNLSMLAFAAMLGDETLKDN
jgi:hypothetical protein